MEKKKKTTCQNGRRPRTHECTYSHSSPGCCNVPTNENYFTEFYDDEVYYVFTEGFFFFFLYVQLFPGRCFHISNFRRRVFFFFHPKKHLIRILRRSTPRGNARIRKRDNIRAVLPIKYAYLLVHYIVNTLPSYARFRRFSGSISFFFLLFFFLIFFFFFTIIYLQRVRVARHRDRGSYNIITIIISDRVVAINNITICVICRVFCCCCFFSFNSRPDQGRTRERGF